MKWLPEIMRHPAMVVGLMLLMLVFGLELGTSIGWRKATIAANDAAPPVEGYAFALDRAKAYSQALLGLCEKNPRLDPDGYWRNRLRQERERIDALPGLPELAPVAPGNEGTGQ